MTLSLAQTQELFWHLITGSRDVPSAEIEGCFVASPELSAHARVGVYTRMYTNRLIDALAADFPNLAQATGDGFCGLARAYLSRWPSEHPSVNDVGRHLAAFLRHPDSHAPRPDLGDLAALEWTRSQSFDAAPATSVPATHLGRIPADALANTTLHFVPCLHVLACAYDVDRLWRALENEQPAPRPRKRRCTLAVWRPQFDVWHTVLKPAEADALQRAISGAPLGELCEAFAALPQPTDAAFAAIGAWFADGWIEALRWDGAACGPV